MKHRYRLFRPASAVIALAVGLVTATGVAAQTAVTKLDPVLRGRAAQLTGRSRVIVQFATEADVRVFSRGSAGRRVSRSALAGEVDNYRLAALMADPRVARIVADRPAFATLERTAGAIGATAAHAELGVTGKGIGVAIIDSGITYYHHDLSRSGRAGGRAVVHFQDFSTPVTSSLWIGEPPHDDYGHGTHVAGIIAGSGAASGGARRGIAPDAHLIGLKVLDRNGHGYISDVIAAIDYAIARRTTFNIRIINLSVASTVVESYMTDPLTLAARRAVQAGIVVVAAAGNFGRNQHDESQFGGITAPGNAPWVLTVGASSHHGTAGRADDTVASFSSRGPTWIDFAAKPDLVAPGVGIESLSDPRSTLYHSLPDYLLDGVLPGSDKPYLSLSGTSMAAPVVTGTVALMLQANPALTPNAVKAILQYTAQLRAGDRLLTQGAGLLNARGAVRLARFFAAPQLGIGEMADEIAGERIAWARHLLWGNYRVSGGVLLPGWSSTAWSLRTTWGALRTASGQPIVWGASRDENIVWSTAVDNNIVWSTSGDENIVWSTLGADENIVWSTARDENIVWSTATDGNIVWSTGGGDENIVWSTSVAQNIVWGNDCGGKNCRNVRWGRQQNGRVWGTASGDENIVWSTSTDGNIVWSTALDDNIVWSTSAAGRVVWPAGVR